MCGTGGPITFQYNIPWIVDGGAVVPALGVKGSRPNIAYAFEILGWDLESAVAGDVTCGLVADPFAAGSYPATDIIGGGTPITMAATKSASGNVAGWARTKFPPGYSLGLSLTNIATITLFTISLKCRRTIGL